MPDVERIETDRREKEYTLRTIPLEDGRWAARLEGIAGGYEREGETRWKAALHVMSLLYEREHHWQND